MRWVLRWPEGSCVGVGRKRGLRCSYTRRKMQQRGGVLEAPLTVEWVATGEAVEVPAIGQLLAVSSCTTGKKVVRGDQHGR
jgi:hypothetical protein